MVEPTEEDLLMELPGVDRNVPPPQQLWIFSDEYDAGKEEHFEAYKQYNLREVLAMPHVYE